MVDLHHDDSAKYLGFLHGGFGVGGLIAPLLIGSLLAVVSWHTVSYLMSALIALATIVFLVLLNASKKGVPAAEKEQPLTRAGIKAYLFQKKNALLLLWVVGGVAMTMKWIPYYDLGYSWFNTHIFQLF